VNESSTVTASFPRVLDGHVDPRQIMDVGVMNGNLPAPLMAIDEDDEFFLTLTNVGMIMRRTCLSSTRSTSRLPERLGVLRRRAGRLGRHQHRRELHLLLPGARCGHLLLALPHHPSRALADGHVGQLYVRPRQNRVAAGSSLYTARVAQDGDLRTACVSATDILCSNPLPAGGATANPATRAPITPTSGYAYNDGDGSTYYNVEYPLQIHGFDPNFHFVA